MKRLTKTLLLAAALVASGVTQGLTAQPTKPTIVLVHGAFADSSSWNAVIAALNDAGYIAIAAANPLRGVAADAASVAAVLHSIAGPVVLVGHSYGGPVITEAANSSGNVKALVYVAGFAPAEGESSLSLSEKFPGSTLTTAITAVPLQTGEQDLFIRPDTFPAQFAADIPLDQARLMAATQRPVTRAALAERSGIASWKRLPSYMLYGSQDRNIPAALLAFMAERAQAVKTVVVEGASHAVMVSHPGEVAALIEAAATAP